MKVLVTAGPTREHLDDVRFISNPSTGKMGYAVAAAAAEAGHHVVLVSGPVDLAPPPGVRLIRVVSAVEMRDAVASAFADCDCLVMTAAVSDYRPATRLAGKLKKTSETLDLKLVRNPDILAEFGAKKGRRRIVGFALEAEDGERNAVAKLRAKHMDWVVLNSPTAFGAERADVTILARNGERTVLEGTSKLDIARKIMDILSSKKR